MAEKLAVVLYFLGVISMVGLVATIKKWTKANLVSYLALTIACVGVFLAQKTGTTGGEIRHTEIRANAVFTAGAEQNTTSGEQGESGDND
jgi:hypothetical protein